MKVTTTLKVWKNPEAVTFSRPIMEGKDIFIPPLYVICYCYIIVHCFRGVYVEPELEIQDNPWATGNEVQRFDTLQLHFTAPFKAINSPVQATSTILFPLRSWTAIREGTVSLFQMKTSPDLVSATLLFRNIKSKLFSD